MAKIWPCELQMAQEIGDWQFNNNFSLHDHRYSVFHLVQQCDVSSKQKAPLLAISCHSNLAVKFPFKRVICLVLFLICRMLLDKLVINCNIIISKCKQVPLDQPKFNCSKKCGVLGESLCQGAPAEGVCNFR